MAKFSVKKPLTVFVAVVAVLVLGIVSFMNMTPDLLPNMDLPYVMVMTPVPGETPEKVETMVTKPLEQAMATLEHIKTVRSTSSESRSMIFLQFAEEVNLDTITVDILQRTAQMGEYWGESVGTPIILKLNPSMLPVMVLAVDMEGMEPTELSRFIEDTLLTKLEGVAGVASVDANGLVADTVEIGLSQSKIDELNQKVRLAVEAQFSEGEDELETAKSEAESGLEEIQSAMDELQGAMDTASGMAGEASGQIDQKQMELMQAKMLLLQQISAMTQKQEELAQYETILQGLQNSLSELDTRRAEAGALVENLKALQGQIVQLEATKAALELELANPALTEEERAQKEQALLDVNASLAQIDAELAALPLPTTRAELPVRLAEAEAALAQIDLGYSALDTALSSYGLGRADIAKALGEVQAGRAQLTEAIAQMQSTLSMLDAGTITIAKAKAEMEKQKLEGIVELSTGSAQLLLAQGQLTGALAQIDSGMEELDKAKKAALEQADLNSIITLEMVSNILMAENFSMPAGMVTEDGTQTLVRVGENFNSLPEMENLLLVDLQLDGLSPIYLRDVADISLKNNSGELYSKIDGKDGVLLTFSKQSTYATATVSSNIRAELNALQTEYPALSYVSLMDQGDYIDIIISAVLQNLLLGAVFAILVLFLFLRDIRPTFITLCSIPISVIFAISMMYFSGVSLNIISLSGLAVGVGMLVDNSVVVIENTYRLRRKGETAIKAAVSGAAQVSGAITASTLTTICVFLPIVFTQGITRQLFTDMALTLAYSLLASLVVALTLVPAMSSGLLKNTSRREGSFAPKVYALYERLAGFALGHKALMLGSVAALLALSIVAVLLRGYIMMPEMDMPEVMVTLTAPKGSTTEETMQYTDELSERVRTMPGVETVGAMLSSGGGFMLGAGMGQGQGGGQQQNSAMLYVLVNEKASGLETAEAINRQFADAPYEVVASGSSSMSGMMDAMGGSGISVELYGENQSELIATARQMAEVLRGTEGCVNVVDGVGDTNPELRFTVDKNKAMAKGLTVAQVYAEVSRLLATQKTATTVSLEGIDTDILVLSPKHGAITPDSMRSFSFMHETAQGEKERVYLRDIAEVEETETSVSINRINQRRYLTVSAEVGSGYNVGQVAGNVERAISASSLPAGVSYQVTGESTSVMEAFGDLALMLLLGVLLVYLIMVAQFQSLKSPFIVMFTIPLAFTGGLAALLIAGMELSIIAVIGFVMLVGIIVNNGIVLVDYTNQLRAEGMDTRAALLEAGKTRIRPIFMTSTTTVLGLSVMALGLGTGAELMQPIAIVCIGGLIYATLLTLLIVPVMYELLNRKKMRVIDEEDLIVSDQ